MKPYISPTTVVQHASPQRMLAVSFKISEKETEQQLTKDYSGWDIWDED